MSDNITLPKEVIEQLLKTLKNSAHWSRLYYGSREVGDAIQDLEFALAAEQPKQEFLALWKDWLKMTLRVNSGDRVFHVERWLPLSEIQQSSLKIVGMEADRAWQELDAVISKRGGT